MSTQPVSKVPIGNISSCVKKIAGRKNFQNYLNQTLLFLFKKFKPSKYLNLCLKCA